MASKYIYVMVTDKAGDLVVVSERSSSHPKDGEIFIRGYSDAKKRKPTRVGRTTAINQAIFSGLLVETTRYGKPPKGAASADDNGGEAE